MKYILCLLFCLASIPLYANPPIFTDSLDDAKKISNDLKMPIITIVSADWCHYCVKLEKSISENLDVFDNYIIVKLDFDQNKEYVEKYKIKKIPTVIYKDKKYVGVSNIDTLKKIIR